MLQARGWRTGLLIATVVAFAGAWLLRSYAPTVFPQWAAMDAWTASQIQSATVPTQAIGLPVRRFDGFFSLDIAGAVAPDVDAHAAPALQHAERLHNRPAGTDASRWIHLEQR